MNYVKRTIPSDGYNYNFYTAPEVLDPSTQVVDPNITYERNMIDYAKMSKRFMNKPFRSPLDIVGNYDWHEAYPYEKFLFNDISTQKPIEAKSVIDFGCGPGRMVNRARRMFDQVDGIDISEYAIDYARKTFVGSNFFVSSGVDVGDAPENYYDIVFSTIAIQHIPVKTIRTNLFRGFYNLLKPGGYLSIQVAYNPTYKAGVWSPDTEHASYDSDFFNATATNGHADMVINNESIDTFRADLGTIYENVNFGLANVSSLYPNLNGHYHAPYWATDWLFIQGRKPVDKV